MRKLHAVESMHRDYGAGHRNMISTQVGLEVERTGRVAKRKATDAARSVQRGAARAANSMPRAPSLSKDAVFWFAVIAALAFLPTLISVLSGPVASGPGGVYV